MRLILMNCWHANQSARSCDSASKLKQRKNNIIVMTYGSHISISRNEQPTGCQNIIESTKVNKVELNWRAINQSPYECGAYISVHQVIHIYLFIHFIAKFQTPSEPTEQFKWTCTHIGTLELAHLTKKLFMCVWHGKHIAVIMTSWWK